MYRQGSSALGQRLGAAASTGACTRLALEVARPHAALIRLFTLEQVGWVGLGRRNRVGLLGVHDGAASLLILLRLHGVQPFTKPGFLRPLPVLPALRHVGWLFHGNPVHLVEQSLDQPQANALEAFAGSLKAVK